MSKFFKFLFNSSFIINDQTLSSHRPSFIIMIVIIIIIIIIICTKYKFYDQAHKRKGKKQRLYNTKKVGKVIIISCRKWDRADNDGGGNCRVLLSLRLASN